jgi:acyl carrier protein
MEKLVIEIISELSDVEASQIDMTTTFKEIGFDYLDVAELVIKIEDTLRITTSDKMFYVLSVSELIEEINKLNNKAQLN